MSQTSWQTICLLPTIILLVVLVISAQFPLDTCLFGSLILIRTTRIFFVRPRLYSMIRIIKCTYRLDCCKKYKCSLMSKIFASKLWLDLVCFNYLQSNYVQNVGQVYFCADHFLMLLWWTTQSESQNSKLTRITKKFLICSFCQSALCIFVFNRTTNLRWLAIKVVSFFIESFFLFFLLAPLSFNPTQISIKHLTQMSKAKIY